MQVSIKIEERNMFEILKPDGSVCSYFTLLNYYLWRRSWKSSSQTVGSWNLYAHVYKDCII